MDADQARTILQVYRPGIDDPGDALFAEALAQLDRDPALRRWFDDEKSFDAAVSASLQSALTVPPPSRFLAPAPQARRRIRKTLAATAAAFALLAFGAGWIAGSYHRPAAGLAPWQTAALQVLSSGEMSFDHQSPSLPELEKWLAAHAAPAPDALPQTFAHLESLGCKVIRINGGTVSITCLQLPSGQAIHAVVADRRAAPDRPSRPVYAHFREWTTVTWQDKGRVIMLAFAGDEAELRKLTRLS